MVRVPARRRCSVPSPAVCCWLDCCADLGRLPQGASTRRSLTCHFLTVAAGAESKRSYFSSTHVQGAGNWSLLWTASRFFGAPERRRGTRPIPSDFRQGRFPFLRLSRSLQQPLQMGDRPKKRLWDFRRFPFLSSPTFLHNNSAQPAAPRTLHPLTIHAPPFF
jgi:hypothetical protein